MADFKELHQKYDQSSADFAKEVTALLNQGYRTVAGYSDPKGIASTVMLEKGNKSLSGGKTHISE